jgi:hypothetical protein
MQKLSPNRLNPSQCEAMNKGQKLGDRAADYAQYRPLRFWIGERYSRSQESGVKRLLNNSFSFKERPNQ